MLGSGGGRDRGTSPLSMISSRTTSLGRRGSVGDVLAPHPGVDAVAAEARVEGLAAWRSRGRRGRRRPGPRRARGRGRQLVVVVGAGSGGRGVWRIVGSRWPRRRQRRDRCGRRGRAPSRTPAGAGACGRSPAGGPGAKVHLREQGVSRRWARRTDGRRRGRWRTGLQENGRASGDGASRDRGLGDLEGLDPMIMACASPQPSTPQASPPQRAAWGAAASKPRPPSR